LTTQAIRSLTDDAINGAVLFEIATGLYTPFLLLVTKYTSAIDNDCFANLTTDTCRIEVGIVEYPVTLSNTTISLDPQGINFVSTHPDSDYATERSPAGTLQGLDHFVDDLCDLAQLPGSSEFTGGLMARMFSQTDSSAYSNFVFDHCPLKWIGPTDFVLNAMQDLMFRASSRPANDTDSQPFKVWQTKSTLVFHSVYWFLLTSSTITLCGVFILFGVFILIGLQGSSISRTLSTLETAKAFSAPLLETRTVDGRCFSDGRGMVETPTPNQAPSMDSEQTRPTDDAEVM
jgi:hypothetical protein